MDEPSATRTNEMGATVLIAGKDLPHQFRMEERTHRRKNPPLDFLPNLRLYYPLQGTKSSLCCVQPTKDACNDNCYDFGFRGMTE
jgi:hypothetical protein